MLRRALGSNFSKHSRHVWCILPRLASLRSAIQEGIQFAPRPYHVAVQSSSSPNKTDSISKLLAGLTAVAGTACLWGGSIASAEASSPPALRAVQESLDRTWEQLSESLTKQGIDASELQPPEARLSFGGHIAITLPLPQDAHPQDLQQNIRRWVSQLARLGSYYVNSRSSVNTNSVHGPTYRVDYDLLPSDHHAPGIKLKLYIPPSQTEQQRTLTISKQQGYTADELDAINQLMTDTFLHPPSSNLRSSIRPGADDPAYQEFPGADYAFEELERLIKSQFIGGLHGMLRDGLDGFFGDLVSPGPASDAEELVPPQQRQPQQHELAPRARGHASQQHQKHQQQDDEGYDWGSREAAQAVQQLRGMGAKVFPPAPKETFDWDMLAGYEQQKRAIEDCLLLPLQHPEVFTGIAERTRKQPGSNRPRAVLFEGPPGTGKTTSVRVISSQAAVPLIYIPLEAVVSKWYGESEQLLAQVFKSAEVLGGAIIFFDELDSLATSRDRGDMHEASRRLLAVLLREIDGFDVSRRTVVIGATNRKQDLDPALISRFDMGVMFGLPDEPCRAQILAQYAKHLEQQDLQVLASRSAGMSGRDLRDVCEQAERRWAAKIIRREVDGGQLEPPLQEYLASAADRAAEHSARHLYDGIPGASM